MGKIKKNLILMSPDPFYCLNVAIRKFRITLVAPTLLDSAALDTHIWIKTVHPLPP